jgi:hypothetical protein
MSAVKNLKNSFSALFLLSTSSVGLGSGYLALGVNWANYSLNSALNGEARSNYYALGPKFLAGFAPLEWLVLVGHAAYHKTSRSESKTDMGPAELVEYGGGFRFHFLSDIQLGLGYSEMLIQNLNMNDADLLTTGNWAGRGPYLSLGSSWKGKNATYPQLSMIVGQWHSDWNEFPENSDRDTTYVAVNLSYVFYQKSVKILDDLIRGFL